jgi:hypothetical protein
MKMIRFAFLVGVACAASACGSRPVYWNSEVINAQSFGLDNGVAILDSAQNRMVMLTASADLQVATQSLSIGHSMVSATRSPDGRSLFVLSAGDFPRHTASDQKPSLTILTDSNKIVSTTSDFHFVGVKYTMPHPLSNLAIDPLGTYAVAYAGSQTTAFVENKNEIVLFDLTKPPSETAPLNPTALTIQAYGGTPQRLTFTPDLQLASTKTRLLVIETDRDLTLLDLQSPTFRQVTVRLTSGTTATQVAPAGVAVYPGVIGDTTQLARIALRALNDSNVFTLLLGPPKDAGSSFFPSINLTDVGGTPSDVEFVKTDQGLRVAALVPSSSKAVLVEPDTSLTTPVKLPSVYSNLSLVTGLSGANAGNVDVALLWGGSSGPSSGVALWALGNTVGQPYRSVEELGVSQPVQNVHDVAAPNQQLKVLDAANSVAFFVLDLVARTVAPLETSSGAALTIAPDGKRMWAYASGGTNLAQIDFQSLSPIPLTTDLAIHGAYDIARTDAPNRALVAVHSTGTVGVTVFDAINPDPTMSRRVSALLLEGP